MQLDKEQFVELVHKLLEALRGRDRMKYTPLFARDAVKQLTRCLRRLQGIIDYAPSNVEDASFKKAIRTCLFPIIDTADSVRIDDVRDDPVSLRTVKEVISEINRLGAAGQFGREADKISYRTNDIKGSLQRREEAVRAYLAAVQPK